MTLETAIKLSLLPVFAISFYFSLAFLKIAYILVKLSPSEREELVRINQLLVQPAARRRAKFFAFFLPKAMALAVNLLISALLGLLAFIIMRHVW